MKTFLALIALSFFLISTPPLGAVNRLFVNNQVLQANGTGQEILVRCDNDVALLAIQVAIKFDPTKLRITAVSLAGITVGAEWTGGQGTTSPADNVKGELVYGIVMDISPPTITKLIPIGTNQTVLKLTVDTLATTSTSTVLDFQDNLGTPALKNVLSDSDGKAIAPATVDATLTIEPFSPLIQTITGNSGSPGKVFTVVGKQFNRPGLAVTICGQAAVHNLDVDGQTLTITAPECPEGSRTPEGWSVMAICNDFGCDSRAEGFQYLKPEIASFLDNTGLAGKQFVVIGRNFDQPGLTVKVCDVDATPTIQVLNGQTMRVTAPPCATEGAAPIVVCNASGCATNPAGFNYEKKSEGTPFIRGDANQDDVVDISDAVTILGDLFLGVPAQAICRDALDANDDGAADISDAVTVLGHLFLGDPPLPPPFPNPGLDPTLDPLPGC